MDLAAVKQFNIPQSSGCYQFLDKQGKIIYIGKAANLRTRVFSYWRASAGLTPAKEEMIRQIKSIRWIETDSEIEALLLEANLVKRHQPIFNVKLRDDKRFVYIKISVEEDWPRVFMTRRLDRAGRYFGPFTSVSAVRTTLKVVRKIWPFRSCARLPKKACLYYRLGQCPGMCIGQAGIKDYQKAIKEIILFLEGKKRIIKDYELEIKKRRLKQKEYKKESRQWQEAQTKIKELKFKLLNLKKVLAGANILGVVDKYAADVVELAKVLGLPRPPARIEGYDIANIFGREAVGSMVVFREGEPAKDEYRRFKIKVGQGQANDIRMLREVLGRRFRNDWPRPDLIVIDGGKAQLCATEQVLREYKLNIPVLTIAKGEGLRSARARDKIFFPGEARPLELPLASPALHILKRVRDEAHRFALSYHRLLRQKRIL